MDCAMNPAMPDLFSANLSSEARYSRARAARSIESKIAGSLRSRNCRESPEKKEARRHRPLGLAAK